MKGHARLRKRVSFWWLYGSMTLALGAAFVVSGVSIGMTLGIPFFWELSGAFTRISLVTPEMMGEALRQAPAFLITGAGVILLMFGLVATVIQLSHWFWNHVE